MEQLMHYNEEILDYLKKGYELNLYTNPEKGLLMINAIKGGLCASASISLMSVEMRACPQNSIYELALKKLQELEEVVNA